ncbi:unnamed protein product [Effrenium voratum]|nr:unnamed protein product [Effrenium voratum]
MAMALSPGIYWTPLAGAPVDCRPCGRMRARRARRHAGHWDAGRVLVPLGLLGERMKSRRKAIKDDSPSHRFGRRQGLLGSALMAPASCRAVFAVPLTVGLGTCCLKGEQSEEQVLNGLSLGYRVIDTASHYDNEVSVGKALVRSKVPREEVFLVTKVWFDDMGERASQAIQESIGRLDTYVDLLLVHFPGTNDAIQSPTANRRLRETTWRALEDAKSAGLTRHLGVANFVRRHLKELLAFCREAPEVMQTEVHPYFQQPELLDLCKRNNLQVQAFSPLAHGQLALLEDPLLKKLGAKYQRSPAQVVLSWLLQKGIAPIAFSRSLERMKENLSGGFVLTAAELERIDLLDRGEDARVRSQLGRVDRAVGADDKSKASLRGHRCV